MPLPLQAHQLVFDQLHDFDFICIIHSFSLIFALFVVHSILMNHGPLNQFSDNMEYHSSITII